LTCPITILSDHLDLGDGKQRSKPETAEGINSFVQWESSL